MSYKLPLLMVNFIPFLNPVLAGFLLGNLTKNLEARLYKFVC